MGEGGKKEGSGRGDWLVIPYFKYVKCSYLIFFSFFFFILPQRQNRALKALAFSKQVLSKDGFSPTGRRDQNKKFESSYLLQWWHNDVANTMKVSQLAYQLPSNRNLFSLAPGRSEHTTFVADFRGGTCNMDHLGHSESEAVALCSQSRYFSLTKPRFDMNRAVTSTKLSIKMLYF